MLGALSFALLERVSTSGRFFPKSFSACKSVAAERLGSLLLNEVA
jgi:hypothetical protein